MGRRATSRAPSTSRKSYLEQQIEAAVPDRDDARSSCTAPAACRSLFAAQTLPDMGYTDVASMTGGFQAWKSERARLDDAARADRRAEAALQPPPADPRGRHRGPGELLDSKVLLIGAGGLGSPGRAVPRGGRRRARSASSTSTSSTSRTSSARSSTPTTGSARRRSSRRARDDQRAQPRRDGRRARGDARRGQRRADHRRLRRDPRRHRHVRDALHAQRRRGRAPASRWSTRRCSGSRASSRSSSRTRARATAASTRRRRRPSSRPAAPWRACSAWCPGSWACSRRTRSSSCCSASARRSPAGCCCSMPSTTDVHRAQAAARPEVPRLLRRGDGRARGRHAAAGRHVRRRRVRAQRRRRGDAARRDAARRPR